MTQKKKKRTKPRWRRMDLHLHTPASADYLESNISYLDILRQAESKGLDIVAFTDHNTVACCRGSSSPPHWVFTFSAFSPPTRTCGS
jgi:DNA polymerase III alpha subunit (gram-positive type)